ncbi:MAG: cupin domain-containing protein [Promethearchaeota archaeon]|nr:MAG: cupin domain-containing protein [Candidatus Lokiarchaeota archaeon]
MNENMTHSKVMELNKLVEYQQGNVVSRTLVTKNTGTITLFAFDKGQGLSEHTTPYDAMVYILDGSAEIIISKKKFQLQSGQMIIMPANEPHALSATEHFKMMLIMIKE